jgi:hypothetical protein
MATARDRINRALKLIGVLAAGETASADIMADGITAFNGMLGQWAADGLMIPTVVREEFTLVVGTSSYTLGPSGATFTTSRPLKVLKAAIEVQGSNPHEVPANILTIHEWAGIRDKAQSSSIPSAVYFEGTNPNETVNVWPVPSAAEHLVLYSEKALTAIADASDTVTLQPGGDDAVDFNLAVRLAPEFGKTPLPDVTTIANESKGNLMRVNFKPQLLECDAAILTRGLSYDINTGSWR